MFLALDYCSWEAVGYTPDKDQGSRKSISIANEATGPIYNEIGWYQ